MLHLRLIITFATILILGSCVWAAPPVPGVSVDVFTEIVALSRLPVAQQTPKITEIYGGWPYGRGPRRDDPHEDPGSEAVRGPALTPAEKDLPVAEQIAVAAQRGDWVRYISFESEVLAHQILRAHPNEVASLIHDDLRSNHGRRKDRALRYLWVLLPSFEYRNREADAAPDFFDARWAQTLYEDVAPIFLEDVEPILPKELRLQPPTSMRFFGSNVFLLTRQGEDTIIGKRDIEGVLIKIGDPRAIALFIDENPSRPDWHYWSISWLALRAPNDAALEPLEKLLASHDAESRYRALFALPAANSALRAALPALLEDTEAKTRELAIAKAFELKGPEFGPARVAIKNRLTDANIKVRFDAAVGLARRGEPIAAPVLLELSRNLTRSSVIYALPAQRALSQLMGEQLAFPVEQSITGE